MVWSMNAREAVCMYNECIMILDKDQDIADAW